MFIPELGFREEEPAEEASSEEDDHWWKGSVDDRTGLDEEVLPPVNIDGPVVLLGC